MSFPLKGPFYIVLDAFRSELNWIFRLVLGIFRAYHRILDRLSYCSPLNIRPLGRGRCFFFPVETRCGGYRHLGHAETAMSVANGGYPKLTIGFGWKMMFETILLDYFKG
jgi:hypothetical protein